MIATFIIYGTIAFAQSPTVSAPAAAPKTTSTVQPTAGQKVMQMKGDKIDAHVMEMKGDVIQSGVMDFKGDVIGADRKPSPVFLEMGAGDPEVGSMIFKRSDFNDFHDAEKKQRVHVMPVDK